MYEGLRLKGTRYNGSPVVIDDRYHQQKRL
jgi:hypothetical protein